MLRRTPRPALPADVRVARGRFGEAPPPPEDPLRLIPRAWRKRAALAEAAAELAKSGNLAGLLEGELGKGADGSEDAGEEEGEALEEALRRLMLASVRGDSDEDDGVGEGAAAAAGTGLSAQLAEELAAELEAGRAARAAKVGARLGAGVQAERLRASHGSRGGGEALAAVRAQQEGLDQADVLAASSGSDDPWALGEGVGVAEADIEEGQDEEWQEEEDEEEGCTPEEVWRSRDAPAVAAAAAAAAGWARIVRPPRKRSGHVVLDLCTASRPPAPAGDNGSSAIRLGADGLEARGELVKQIVAAADKRAWLGPAGYRLARKARWGDLWPRWYEERAITVKGGGDGS